MKTGQLKNKTVKIYTHLKRSDVVMTTSRDQIVDSNFPFSIYNVEP